MDTGQIEGFSRELKRVVGPLRCGGGYGDAGADPPRNGPRGMEEIAPVLAAAYAGRVRGGKEHAAMASHLRNIASAFPPAVRVGIRFKSQGPMEAAVAAEPPESHPLNPPTDGMGDPGCGPEGGLATRGTKGACDCSSPAPGPPPSSPYRTPLYVTEAVARTLHGRPAEAEHDTGPAELPRSRHKLVACGRDAAIALSLIQPGSVPGEVLLFKPDAHASDFPAPPPPPPAPSVPRRRGWLARLSGWLGLGKGGGGPSQERTDPTRFIGSLSDLVGAPERWPHEVIVDNLSEAMRDAEVCMAVAGADTEAVDALIEFVAGSHPPRPFLLVGLIQPALSTEAQRTFLRRLLHRLRGYCDLPILIPLLSLVAPETLTLAFTEMVRLVTVPGVVNLDKADIATTVPPGDASLLVVSEIEPGASDRFGDVLDQSCPAPLFAFRRALMHVAGGEDLTVDECQTMTAALKDRLRPGARIIWGATIDPELGGRARVLVLLGASAEEILAALSPGPAYADTRGGDPGVPRPY